MSTVTSSQTSHASTALNESHSLVQKMANKYGVEANELPTILKATAFRQVDGIQISNEQMFALLAVADRYDLNPFVGEIKAYQDVRSSIIPVVGIDGWNRIANSHPQFDGVEFVYSDSFVELEGSDVPCHAWIEVVIHRKDRDHPTRIKEYIDECYRVIKDPVTGETLKLHWQTHPKRNLRHKALVQGYRVALSLVGIYDEDEAQRILASQRDDVRKPAPVVPLTRTTKPAKHTSLDQPSKDNPVTSPGQTVGSDTGLDKSKFEDFVAKLVERGKANGQWKAALSLCKERLVGNQLAYATEIITRAEQLSMAVSTTGSVEVASSENVPEEKIPTVQSNDTVVTDLLDTSSDVDF